MSFNLFNDNHTFVGFIKIDNPHHIDFNGDKRDRIFIGVYDNENKDRIKKVGQGVYCVNRKLTFGIKLFDIDYEIRIVDINFDNMATQDIKVYKYITKNI
jgi:hypothetical protein